MKIGYARVSSESQSTNLQVQQLLELGCEKIFQENMSGVAIKRVELNNMLEFARAGDIVIVTKVDRIARNTIKALQIADRLKDKGVGFICQDLSTIDINSDVGRVIYTIISAFAEMERKRILKRCNEGREKAKAEGKHLGRKKNIELHQEIRRLNTEGFNKSQIAKQLNCSRPTVYTVIKS